MPTRPDVPTGSFRGRTSGLFPSPDAIGPPKMRPPRSIGVSTPGCFAGTCVSGTQIAMETFLAHVPRVVIEHRCCRVRCADLDGKSWKSRCCEPRWDGPHSGPYRISPIWAHEPHFRCYGHHSSPAAARLYPTVGTWIETSAPRGNEGKICDHGPGSLQDHPIPGSTTRGDALITGRDGRPEDQSPHVVPASDQYGRTPGSTR